MTESTDEPQRCVVVGASLAGMRAAEAVRKAGFAGEIVVIGDEPHMPYYRPPLSKDTLASAPGPVAADPAGPDPVTCTLATLAFRVPKNVQEAQWRLGRTVTAADLTARTVTLEDGEVLGWSGLVVATGLRPRRLSVPGPTLGRHVIRTLDDSLRLRAELVPAARLVVIGAGFIGCEVAASARTMGVEVDVVAPESVPAQRPLQTELGNALRRRHEEYGVRFHLGTVPTAFLGQERVTGVVLSDGTELPADLVLEAVGCVPNVEWLEGNGLDLSDGVLCDNSLRVEGRPDIVACGDVAKFANPRFDDVPRRIEHWTLVTDTAKRAGLTLGRYLAGAEPAADPFAPLPTFWSDQYGLRLQSFGAVGLGAADVRVLEGDLDGEVAVGYHLDGRLVGVVLIGMAAHYPRFRSMIADVRQPAEANSVP
jgi:3-phenylpropionate/trans-cinnamate dioxygenase ferredoxin reductase component